MPPSRLLGFLLCLLLLPARDSAAPRTYTTADGQTERRALELQKPVERVIADGETHHYSLRLTAGDFLHVFVRQRGVNVVTTLLGPDGKTLLEADSPVTTQEADW